MAPQSDQSRLALWDALNSGEPTLQMLALAVVPSCESNPPSHLSIFRDSLILFASMHYSGLSEEASNIPRLSVMIPYTAELRAVISVHCNTRLCNAACRGSEQLLDLS